MEKGKYFGVYVPLITPFSKDYSIDYDALEELLNFLLASGVNGFFVNATTGEFTSLSLEEKEEIANLVLSTAKGKARLFLNVASTDVREVKKLCRFAAEKGFDAVISPPPYFLIPDERGLLNYFITIAEESNLDTLIYNIPPATGYSFLPKLVEELADSDSRIKGVKATIDSIGYLRDVILTVKKKHPDFSVLTGVEHNFLPNLLCGGDGGIVALSNFAPSFFIETVKSFDEKNFDSLLELHRKITTLSRIFSYSTSFASGIKISLSLMGFKVQPFVRRPLIEDPQEVIEHIRQILIGTGLLKED